MRNRSSPRGEENGVTNNILVFHGICGLFDPSSDEFSVY